MLDKKKEIMTWKSHAFKEFSKKKLYLLVFLVNIYF